MIDWTKSADNMSGQSEDTGPRSGSNVSRVIGSVFPEDQIRSDGDEEGKLSEKVVQFMKVCIQCFFHIELFNTYLLVYVSGAYYCPVCRELEKGLSINYVNNV